MSQDGETEEEKRLLFSIAMLCESSPVRGAEKASALIGVLFRLMDKRVVPKAETAAAFIGMWNAAYGRTESESMGKVAVAAALDAIRNQPVTTDFKLGALLAACCQLEVERGHNSMDLFERLLVVWGKNHGLAGIEHAPPSLASEQIGRDRARQLDQLLRSWKDASPVHLLALLLGSIIVQAKGAQIGPDAVHRLIDNNWATAEVPEAVS